MQTRKILVLGLALAVVTATGCGEGETSSAPTTADFTKEREALAARKSTDKQPSKAPVKRGKKSKASGGGGTSYAAGGRDYFYDPTDKRDPFRSFQFDDEGKQDKKTFGPLADFELGQLELSAVIWDANNPRALILDPGGRSYIVREGSQIGKNNGEVIHIGDNLVLVKETYENFAGERTTKDVELRIRLSQGG
jgi:Tfp pilus assembly protein PilP